MSSGHDIFSLGGALARVWHPRYRLLPWALTSALLMTAGLWDYWTVGGRVEWVVVGLSAYELMIGLLDRPAEAPAFGPGAAGRDVEQRRDS